MAGQTFTVTQAGVSCTYAISATSQALTAAGGAGSVTVTAPSGCAWTAASSAAWLTVTSGASGTGTGPVAFSAAANTTTSARTATLTVAGQTFTVTQAGVSCTYAISPTSQVFTSTGGTGSIAVMSSLGCAWTATSNAAWLTITAGASGSGDGAVSITAAANTGTTARTGVLTIGGQTFTVTQAGTVCSYTVSPLTVSLPSSAGTSTVAITTASGCTWSAASSATWLTLTPGSSGTGSGSVTFSVSSNTGASARTGTFLVAGRTVTVTQAGTTNCTFALTPDTRSVNKKATTGTLSVTPITGCSWTATSSASWLTVTSATQSTGVVNYKVMANSSGVQRVGTIVIGGTTFTLTQRIDAQPNPPTSLRIVGGGQ